MTLINDCRASFILGQGQANDFALITTICRKFAKVANTTKIAE